jgi:hypothetical protein
MSSDDVRDCRSGKENRSSYDKKGLTKQHFSDG